MFHSKLSFVGGLLVLLAFFLSGPSAFASIIVEFQSASATVVPGSIGNELYVLLANDGNAPTGPFTLAGFTVTLTTPLGAGVSFGGGDSSIGNYLFTGNSLGFEFNYPSAPDLNSAEIHDDAANLNEIIGDVTTYGLGAHLFQREPIGPVNVTVVANLNGQELEFMSLDGQINIAAVPEPASLAIWGGIGIAGIVAGWRRKRAMALAV